MSRALLASVSFAIASVVTLPAWADKIAILRFSSPNNTPRPELEEVRKWTREAATKKGHVYATDNELVSAEAVVRDGVADTSQEYLAAGKAVSAGWTLTGRVERKDHPSAKLPDGTEEEGYTTYRLELEALQVETGRLESLTREVLPDEGPSDIAEMVGLLVRPEGIANAVLPWDGAGARRPKPKPKLAPPPPPPPEVVSPPPEAPALPRLVYGAGHPLSVGASGGVTNALVRPDNARGPSWGVPIGVVVGYAFPEDAPGLEVKGNVTTQVVGPRALEVSAGARYALAPLRNARLFVGPELLLGAHVALGADKTARFLAHGALFVAYGITDVVQVEIAGDLASALGGGGALVLGGGSARVVVRF